MLVIVIRVAARISSNECMKSTSEFRTSKMNDVHGKIFDLGIDQAYSSLVDINNSSSSAYAQLVSPISGDWITARRLRFIELFSLSAQATPVLRT
jgi:hypothetical protein